MSVCLKQLFFTTIFMLVIVILSTFVVVPFVAKIETYFNYRSECADVAESFDLRLETFKETVNTTFAEIRSPNLGYRSSCEILGNCVDVLRNCSHVDQVKLEKKVQMFKNCCEAFVLVGVGLDKLETEEEEEQSDDLKCEWIEK